MLLLTSFLLFLTYSSAQKVIDLKSFRGGRVHNPIDNPGPFAVFVSASSDLVEHLNQISVVSEDGSTHTMSELIANKRFPESSLLAPFPVVKSAYVISNLTDYQMNTLTGFMFVSSSKQLQDDSFYVFAVDSLRKWSWTGLGLINTTILFLNSNFDVTPWHSTTISGWSQPSNAVNNLYIGFPKDTVEVPNSQIFSVPVFTTKGYAKIQNVEKLSLSLPTFYIKSYGGAQFSIEPSYYDVNNQATTAATTTGFYMKPINQVDKEIVINTVQGDNVINGTVGANVVGSVPDNGKVTIGEHDGLSFSSNSVHPVSQILAWSTQGIGKIFQIDSENTQAGEYYVQYYVMDGPQLPTTSRPVITTTMSSVTWKLLISLLIPCLMFL